MTDGILDGKTRSRFLTAEQAALVGKQIDVGRKLRARVDDYWEACEEWADQTGCEKCGLARGRWPLAPGRLHAAF